MSKRNLILCFSSLRPHQYEESMLIQREKNYSLSLEWLLKSLPDHWDIIYNDNTLSNLSEIKNEELRYKLTNERIRVILHQNNEGSVNKGAGEHSMCKKSFESIDPDNYNWISYFTARHIIPNPWYFENLDNNWKDYDSVMSNPAFFYLTNYLKSDPTPGLYNDMLFSMKSDVFKKFIDHIDVELLKRNHMNSENHLYSFFSSGEFNNLEIENLGILRNDHQSYGWHLV